MTPKLLIVFHINITIVITFLIMLSVCQYSTEVLEKSVYEFNVEKHFIYTISK